jgi:hypothetical protein
MLSRFLRPVFLRDLRNPKSNYQVKTQQKSRRTSAGPKILYKTTSLFAESQELNFRLFRSFSEYRVQLPTAALRWYLQKSD